jgi:hypothetical protein
METTDRLDRWIPRLMVLTIMAVAVFAFVQSYTHVYSLGQTHHQTGASLRMLPLSVDWVMFAAGLAMLHLGRKGIRHPLPRATLILGATATLIANIAFGIVFGWETAVISSWAPVALFVVVELGMLLVRTAKAKPARDDAQEIRGELAKIGVKPDEIIQFDKPLTPREVAEIKQQLTELRTPQASPDPEPETMAIPVVPEVTGGPQENLAGWGQLGQPEEPAGQPGRLGRQEPSGGLTGIGLANGRK